MSPCLRSIFLFLLRHPTLTLAPSTRLSLAIASPPSPLPTFFASRTAPLRCPAGRTLLRPRTSLHPYTLSQILTERAFMQVPLPQSLRPLSAPHVGLVKTHKSHPKSYLQHLSLLAHLRPIADALTRPTACPATGNFSPCFLRSPASAYFTPH